MRLEGIKTLINETQTMEELAQVLNKLAEACCNQCTKENGFEDTCACQNHLCFKHIENVEKIQLFENQEGTVYFDGICHKVHWKKEDNRPTDYAFSDKEEAVRYLESI